MKAVIIHHEEFVDAFIRSNWTGTKDFRNLHECRNHNGEIQMKYLAVLLSSMTLVACGGGGGSASSDASASASADLSKYAGVWRQDCVNHMRLTRTATATGSRTFSVMTKEEYFDNADCTGALVATGSFGQPDEIVTYAPTLANASVTLQGGGIVTADVDPAASVSAGAPLSPVPFNVTGSGVTSTAYVLDTTSAIITYTNLDTTAVVRTALKGQTTIGALLLLNGELLSLVPIGASATSFQVNRRYIR
ncbi:hypothetical protein [Rhodoferax sp.]|uniref:hypothetical protein n=1 Tax=Rhodoferax sp. TaxID=50421 RepID=UPI002724FE67|nr:hypothetical protein [Rhodoferax sp.]MDO9199668.1 hypothetical protein [Rhodoferax sp.]